VTAIDAVAAFLPEAAVPIESLAGELGLTSMQVRVFRRYHGLAEVRWDRDGSLGDLLDGAVTALDALRGREDDVRHVLYARAFGVVEPYPLNTLHEVCQRAGLGHAAAFTVTHQSCATGLVALDLAGRLLAAEPDPAALALVLAGEKAFTFESRLLPETSIFGEGASACLVRRDGERDRLVTYVARQRGDFDGERADVAARFEREYPESLAEVILSAVDKAGLGLDEIALILPHNVNVVSWQRLCRRLGYPVERVLLDVIARTGHVFCADAFINLRAALERDLLRPGQHYLIAAAGAGRGATFSAMVFEH
jgi:3-oxoacyl-[acyl-carrier-protein] synthase-3